MKRLLQILLLSVLVLIAARSYSQGQATTSAGPFQSFSSNDKTPIDITTDHMELRLKENKMEFKGHVTAKQGKRTIYADRMDVSFTKDWKVTLLEAKGNVKVNLGDSFATCDFLKLDNVREVIYLRGNPRVVQKDQIVMGKEMTYEMKTEKIVVIEPRIELRNVEQTPAAAPKEKQKEGAKEAPKDAPKQEPKEEKDK